MSYRNSEVREPGTGILVLGIFGVVVVVVLILAGLFWAFPEYGRAQARANAENQVQINEIVIRQQEQNIQVEKQKAAIRVVEAQGIAQAQEIINATLTDKYLIHESIQAQEAMVNSPNHSVIYIPTGDMGVPIVRTTNGDETAAPGK